VLRADYLLRAAIAAELAFARRQPSGHLDGSDTGQFAAFMPAGKPDAVRAMAGMTDAAAPLAVDLDGQCVQPGGHAALLDTGHAAWVAVAACAAAFACARAEARPVPVTASTSNALASTIDRLRCMMPP
jgi:hypothetical protein